MDSLLAAVAVPSNMGSSPDPKSFLSGNHTGTGLNPGVTPKGLQHKVWWNTGQHQTQGSLQPEDTSPVPAAVPPTSTPFLHHPLYTARGGNVAKSPSMKRKWQPKGPFPGPPRCLSLASGSLQPSVTLLSRMSQATLHWGCIQGFIVIPVMMHPRGLHLGVSNLSPGPQWMRGSLSRHSCVLQYPQERRSSPRTWSVGDGNAGLSVCFPFDRAKVVSTFAGSTGRLQGWIALCWRLLWRTPPG